HFVPGQVTARHGDIGSDFVFRTGGGEQPAVQAVIAPVNAEGNFVKVITFTGNNIINFQRHQSTRHHFRIGIAQRERQALAVRNGVTEGNVTTGNVGLIITDRIQLGKVGVAVKQVKTTADAINGVIRVKERK